MQFLGGVIGMLWATIVSSILLFPITVPVLLIFPWLMWMGPSAKRTDAVPRSVWFPVVGIVLLLVWGTAFGVSQKAPWHGWAWPAAVGVGIYVSCCVLAWRVWRQSGRDRRVTGLLLVELWFGGVATWVVAAAVSPGSGLGAL